MSQDTSDYKALRSGLMSDLQFSSSTKHEKSYEQQGAKEIFRTEFPMPEPPRPNFSNSIFNSLDSKYNTGSKNSNDRDGYITTRSGIVFRSSDATVRAMKDLEVRRNELKMKKRAGVLVVGLLLVALTILNATMSNMSTNLRNSPSDVKTVTAEDGTVNVVGTGETLSTASELEGGETIENIESIPDEATPEEEVIEEGKEFLQPFRYFADSTTHRHTGDSNFFFHIPRSGGETIKEIAGRCLGKTLVSEVGVGEGHDQDVVLQKVEVDGVEYVNVDTTSIDGLHRAANLGLAASDLSDLISSSYFGEVGMLFDLEHKGRAFTILREPIERAVSMYYHVTRGDQAYIDPSVTLEDYAQGNGIENNWVIRFMTGHMEGEIKKEHLEEAKEILAKKFVVGFMDDAEETVYRIMKYFDWAFEEDENVRMQQEDCIKDLITGRANKAVVKYDIPKRGSQAQALIKWQTQFDIKLYEYARELFEQQTKHFGSKARKKLLKKKKKEKAKEKIK
jgi:hypothetical protein